MHSFSCLQNQTRKMGLINTGMLQRNRSISESDRTVESDLPIYQKRGREKLFLHYSHCGSLVKFL